MNLTDYPFGFEEDDCLRSAFVRGITLEYLDQPPARAISPVTRQTVPKTLVQYWHDPREVPNDVLACLDSWKPLREEGFSFRTFDDVSATAFIAERYGVRERRAFSRCRHPAMRSDYLRMCFVLAEGGFYVDADDVLIGDGWRRFFLDDRLKVQLLCYDVPSGKMVAAADIWRIDLPTAGRIFYVNNNPIAAPAGHSILRRALARSTDLLLSENGSPEIQSTTGPGNLTAALVAHARELKLAQSVPDFEFLRDWDQVAETRWNLSYRNDVRNWRNMDAS